MGFAGVFAGLVGSAQPTFHGADANPADNGLSATSPVSVTPPASMVAGDLVVMYGQTRTTAATIAISADGGQSWTSETAGGTTDQTTRIFWCRFNGTWGADPSLSFSATLNTQVGILVFRPTSSSKLWAVDQAVVNTPYSTPTGPPYVITITGVTNAQPNNVSVAIYSSIEDNTWGSLTGTGWTAALSPIYRRCPSGSDQSFTPVYKLSASTGATGNTTANQSAVGPDPGSTVIISFYEYSAPTTNRGMPLNLIVQ